jgi:hypothetical protein
MALRPFTATALAAALAAGAFFTAPASAQTVGFGLSFNVPGLSVAVGTPALAVGPVVAPPLVAPVPAYAYVPYRPYYKRWYRPYAPVVYRQPVVAYPAPVVVRPRPIAYAAPYARPVAAPYYGVY